VSGALGFDLSPSLCGWAYISAAGIEADAFRLPAVGHDLGTLLAVLEQHFETLKTRFSPTVCSYEAPIRLRHDADLTLRQNFGLGAGLEYFCLRSAIPCHEIDLRRVKSIMTNDSRAEKAHVVNAALKLGVILPATAEAGRKDAADAVGVALETMRLLYPEIAAPLLAKLNGTLL
jgi:Holliday junction resolvasome RuvABC endonuclease subunit